MEDQVIKSAQERMKELEDMIAVAPKSPFSARREKPAPVVPSFCPDCGEKILPGARFCRSCGRSLAFFSDESRKND